MKFQSFIHFAVLVLLGSFGIVSNLSSQPITESDTNPKTLKIYPLPQSFQEGYVSLISSLVSPQEQLNYPSQSDSILDATSSTSDEFTTETVAQNVHYDPSLKILTVLTTNELHQQVQHFLDQLTTSQYSDTKIQYRIAFVERTIHPKLKDYPFEFRITGKCWGKGRDRNKRPQWIIDYRERYPNVLFSDVDLDRENKDTRFEIHGFAKQKQPMDELIQIIHKADDTNSDDHWEQHDFMQESQQNLHTVLSDIFPKSKLNSIISSLQTTGVYQVKREASFAVESKAPGFLRSDIGDEYCLEIQAVDGIDKKGKTNIEVYVYKKDHPNDTPFEKNDLHLATSLLTQYNQINMIGIRHRDKRYVILLSMEEVK